MPTERSNWDLAPIWFKAALHEIGVHETGDNRGPDVQRYIAAAKCGQLGDPWCAIFANAMLELNGIRGTRLPLARSFERSDFFRRLPGPALGAIVTFWRGTTHIGLGHVGFYRGESLTHVYTLGGNESDQVQIAPYPKHSARFGLVGYWWPVSEDATEILGGVSIRAGTPLSVEPSKVT